MHVLPTASPAISMVLALLVPQHTSSVLLDHAVHALKSAYLVMLRMSVTNVQWAMFLQPTASASNVLIIVNTAKT